MIRELFKLFSDKISKILVIVVIVLIGLPYILNYRFYNITKEKIDGCKYLIHQMELDGIDRMKATGYLENEVDDISSHTDDRYVPRYSNSRMEDLQVVNTVLRVANYVYYDFTEVRYEVLKNTQFRYNLATKPREERMLRKAYNMYNRVVDLPFDVVGIDSNVVVFGESNSKLECLIIALFVAFLSLKMFSMDYQSGAYRLIGTSKCNLGKLYFKQVATVVVFIVAIVAIQAMMTFGACAYVYGASFFTAPIQINSTYEMCPYLITNMEFLLISYGVLLGFYLCVMAVVCMLTRVSRNTIVSIIGSLGLLGIGIALREFASHNVVLDMMNHRFNPFSLLNMQSYFAQFDYENIGEWPINSFVLCVVTMVVGTILSLAVGYILTGYREKRNDS